ncbi:MAG: SpoIIE family protein phosphatase, partial [Desulfobacteraceae bacterium]|nr:SpoIIE family protein phosphatase [Desulfobacteraceae bacterium]
LHAVVYLENSLAADAFTEQGLEVLKILSAQFAISMENARRYASLEQTTKIATEMEIAANIQSGLIPKEPAIKGYEISAYMEPADDVGGDYYDIINFADRDWLVIGDVSGHGVSAGLVMLMVQASLHSVLSLKAQIDPSDLLTVINKTIAENIRKIGEDKHVTIIVLSVKKHGKFTFSGLHEDIIIYRAASESLELVETEGMWIGLLDDIDELLNDDFFTMNPGDVLLLFTDGITEALRKKTDEKEMFGDDKLRDIFHSLGHRSTEEIKQGVLDSLKDYDRKDDVTMVVVKRLE